jgi:hypothetical protein
VIFVQSHQPTLGNVIFYFIFNFILLIYNFFCFFQQMKLYEDWGLMNPKTLIWTTQFHLERKPNRLILAVEFMASAMGTNRTPIQATQPQRPERRPYPGPWFHWCCHAQLMIGYPHLF